jgi:hypothetical protein
LEIVEKVVEVDLPVELGVCRLWKVSSSLLATTPTLEEIFIDVKCVVEMFARLILEVITDLDDTLRTLVVHFRLSTDDVRFVVLFGYDRVPSRKFVYTGGAVPHVLSGDVYGHFDVKLEIDHLKGGRVPMSEEISDESPVSTGGFGAVTI